MYLKKWKQHLVDNWRSIRFRTGRAWALGDYTFSSCRRRWSWLRSCCCWRCHCFCCYWFKCRRGQAWRDQMKAVVASVRKSVRWSVAWVVICRGVEVVHSLLWVRKVPAGWQWDVFCIRLAALRSLLYSLILSYTHRGVFFPEKKGLWLHWNKEIQQGSLLVICRFCRHWTRCRDLDLGCTLLLHIELEDALSVTLLGSSESVAVIVDHMFG